MRFSILPHGLASAAVVLSGVACQSPGSALRTTSAETGVATMPLLAPGEGERRTRRFAGGGVALIKVDRRNGGSQELMMGYEELSIGQAIPPHHHPAMDEIIFIHGGTGTVELGDKTSAVASGTTVFIPRATHVSLRNTGTEPLAIAFFFSHSGYEEYLRETSAPDGQVASPMSASELADIRERHKAHIVFDH